MVRPRVAYILFDFHISGMGSWIRRLASRISDRFECHFIATRVADIAQPFREIGRAVYVPEESRRIVRYLRENRIDIVQYANARFFGECALAAGAPVVVERTDGLRNGEALHPKDGLDAVIASTRGTIEPISRIIARDRINLIYNGVDVASFDAVDPDRRGFGPEDVVIGRTSRFGRGKNIGLLIEAIARIRDDCPQAALVIVGGDSRVPGAEPMDAELRQQAEVLGDRCVFTGPLDDPRAVIRGFDVGTCSSRADNEGIPNSLIEPMACGAPVVTTDTGDVRELVTDGEEGYVVPDGDVEAFADRLRSLVSDAAKRRQMGKVARRKVDESFDLDRQAEQYATLYRQLLDERRRGFARWATVGKYRLKHWRAFLPISRKGGGA